VLSGELGVSQAFLAIWYIGDGHMDVSEVAVYPFIYRTQKRYSQPNIYNPTNNEISLTVYNMHLYCDHTVYSFPLYTFL